MSEDYNIVNRKFIYKLGFDFLLFPKYVYIGNDIKKCWGKIYSVKCYQFSRDLRRYSWDKAMHYNKTIKYKLYFLSKEEAINAIKRMETITNEK